MCGGCGCVTSDHCRDRARFTGMKHALIFLAIFLVVIWIVARVVLAVTSLALHALWVVALIFLVIWMVNRAKA